MTNQELSDRLCAAKGAVSVHMSQAGVTLTIDGVTELIDLKQAEIVWLLLPEIMKARGRADGE